jgi:hypothetical protein
MRQTRLPARNLAAPIRWSCAGNDPTWPKAPDLRRKCPERRLPQPLSHSPSSPDACRYRVRVNVRGDREPTINACAPIKSP